MNDGRVAIEPIYVSMAAHRRMDAVVRLFGDVAEVNVALIGPKCMTTWCYPDTVMDDAKPSKSLQEHKPGSGRATYRPVAHTGF